MKNVMKHLFVLSVLMIGLFLASCATTDADGYRYYSNKDANLPTVMYGVYHSDSSDDILEITPKNVNLNGYELLKGGNALDKYKVEGTTIFINKYNGGISKITFDNSTDTIYYFGEGGSKKSYTKGKVESSWY